jgi:hypothetical protein
MFLLTNQPWNSPKNWLNTLLQTKYFSPTLAAKQTKRRSSWRENTHRRILAAKKMKSFHLPNLSMDVLYSR